MECTMEIDCDTNHRIKFRANTADAEERRFLFKLANGQLEIKGCENVQVGFSPDERMGCDLLLGYKEGREIG